MHPGQRRPPQIGQRSEAAAPRSARSGVHVGAHAVVTRVRHARLHAAAPGCRLGRRANPGAVGVAGGRASDATPTTESHQMTAALRDASAARRARAHAAPEAGVQSPTRGRPLHALASAVQPAGPTPLRIKRRARSQWKEALLQPARRFECSPVGAGPACGRRLTGHRPVVATDAISAAKHRTAGRRPVRMVCTRGLGSLFLVCTLPCAVPPGASRLTWSRVTLRITPPFNSLKQFSCEGGQLLRHMGTVRGQRGWVSAVREPRRLSSCRRLTAEWRLWLQPRPLARAVYPVSQQAATTAAGADARRRAQTGAADIAAMSAAHHGHGGTGGARDARVGTDAAAAGRVTAPRPASPCSNAPAVAARAVPVVVIHQQARAHEVRAHFK